MLENLLLNAVIAKRDFSALVRHGLADARHFHEQKCAFQYIKKHMQEFGELPSVESVVMNCPEFEPCEVVENIDTLCFKLIERNLKLEEKELIQDVAKKFGEMDGYKILNHMRDKIEELQERSLSRGKNGVNWSTNGADRLAEYEARKAKDFTTKIPFFFDEITEATGGAERGEVVTIMAFTGKGKSWLGLLQALKANRAGFKVLIESAEMSKPENLFRLDTLEGKFSNRGLWTGQLGFAETEYKKYLNGFTKDSGRPDLIIKTPEDWAEGLTLEQLEYDIERTKCDVVVVDQFNLLRFKGSTRNDMSAYSRALKQLAAKKGVVLVLLYQTNGDYEKSTSKGEDGIRELKAPTLKDYSETIAVIQDSNKVFGFDSVTWRDEATGRQRGKGIVSIAKSRSGGEGLELELDWQPNDGIIKPRQATDLF